MSKSSCTTCCSRFVNGIPSAFILLVIFWSYFAYVVAFGVKTLETEVEKGLFLFVYHILLILFLSNFLRAIFDKPQSPPDCYKITTEDFNRLIHEPTRDKIMTEIFQARKLKIHTRHDNNSINICDKCYTLKPDRTHHCSTCGQCVLKMDHHCPWVSNCVGYHNYKFFVVFLFWGSIYCIFILGTTFKYFMNFWTVQRPIIPWTDFQILFLFIASIMFGLSQLILFFYHLKLIIYNQTTLESFRAVHVTGVGEREDAFDIGKIENIKEVLGDRIILWGLPIFTSRGNGYEFKMRTSQNCEEADDLSSKTKRTSEYLPELN